MLMNRIREKNQLHPKVTNNMKKAINPASRAVTIVRAINPVSKAVISPAISSAKVVTSSVKAVISPVTSSVTSSHRPLANKKPMPRAAQ